MVPSSGFPVRVRSRKAAPGLSGNGSPSLRSALSPQYSSFRSRFPCSSGSRSAHFSGSSPIERGEDDASARPSQSSTWSFFRSSNSGKLELLGRSPSRRAALWVSNGKRHGAGGTQSITLPVGETTSSTPRLELCSSAPVSARSARSLPRRPRFREARTHGARLGTTRLTAGAFGEHSQAGT